MGPRRVSGVIALYALRCQDRAVVQPQRNPSARGNSLTTCSGVIDYADDAEGAVPWFALRVTAKGRRTFTVGYRVGRRKRRVRLGTWPGVSLAAARERARRILAEVTQGGVAVGLTGRGAARRSCGGATPLPTGPTLDGNRGDALA